jgi:hypothetical protein
MTAAQGRVANQLRQRQAQEGGSSCGEGGYMAFELEKLPTSELVVEVGLPPHHSSTAA